MNVVNSFQNLYRFTQFRWTFRSLNLVSLLNFRISSLESNLLGTIYQVIVFVQSVKKVTAPFIVFWLARETGFKKTYCSNCKWEEPLKWNCLTFIIYCSMSSSFSDYLALSALLLKVFLHQDSHRLETAFASQMPMLSVPHLQSTVFPDRTKQQRSGW